MNLTLPETFNNYIRFEPGFWQRQSRSFATVPKTRVIGTLPNGDYRSKLGVLTICGYATNWLKETVGTPRLQGRRGQRLGSWHTTRARSHQGFANLFDISLERPATTAAGLARLEIITQNIGSKHNG